jgi:hypothetical protein
MAATELQALATSPDGLAAIDRAAVGFARKMMREAYAVTDAEVKYLIDVLGESRVVALVALLAHASFQDRVFLALNLPAEPAEPCPPLTVQFSRPKSEPSPAPAHAPAKAEPARSGTAHALASEAWEELQAGLGKQRARLGRLRVPSQDEVLQRIGAKHPAAWQAGILWSRVCYGHQPELTDAWFACVAAFRHETKQERVFEQCIFWVVTQALQCFY